MLIATATVLHRVFTFDKSLTVTVTTGLVLGGLMSIFIAWHCIVDETFWHSILFGVMIAVVGAKTRSIISSRVSDVVVRAEVRKLATWGAILFISGFAIWNIDNEFCSSLTTLKRALGMPWSFIFELHGWWHILTGMGAYIFIALVEYLTSEEAGQPLGKRFAWPINGIVNGSAGAEGATGEQKKKKTTTRESAKERKGF
ncbi:alkaline phytoceramidase [Phlyctema vagabunda]|uniref:Alkaline phytoceramidase n=1 Tax=Phlyctema vagabunda TaxID=108571 RepID=A0ABR4PL62_9HELO